MLSFFFTSDLNVELDFERAFSFVYCGEDKRPNRLCKNLGFV